MQDSRFICNFVAECKSYQQIAKKHKTMQTLQNGLLNVQISEEGAEMHSIRYGEREYLWNGEPTF